MSNHMQRLKDTVKLKNTLKVSYQVLIVQLLIGPFKINKIYTHHISYGLNLFLTPCHSILPLLDAERMKLQ